MISIDFTNINNAQLVSRLLPFWTRGKKLNLLLQALLSPLVSIHDKFKVWALDFYIQCHITGQFKSLTWYLNYKLSSHFKYSDDSFSISDSTSLGAISAVKFGDTSKGQIFSDRNLAIDYAFTVTITAPQIVETMTYDNSDYERDIRYIASQYLTTFVAINIQVLQFQAIAL